jgi:hypothetical protein
MLRSLRELERTSVTAIDGDVGSVANFLFDDDRWIVRYFVVETRSDFANRRILISPTASCHLDGTTGVLQLELTRDEIETSAPPEPPGGNEDALRSVQDVTGYHVHGSDHAIGHVADFLVDDATWAIRYLVVDTSRWWAGREVLVAPEWAMRISYDERRLFMDMTRDAIENSPPWPDRAAVDRNYEGRLHLHHGRAGYWSRESVRLVHEAEGAASGAIAGTVVGAAAGPPGMAAGAIIGAAAGAMAGAALDAEGESRALRTRELDAVIGVSGGDMGAPNLLHPPSKVGAFSGASVGGGGSDGGAPAEGPMQSPDK